MYNWTAHRNPQALRSLSLWLEFLTNSGCWDGGALLGSTCFCLWFAQRLLRWNLRMFAGAVGYRSAVASLFQTQLQHWGSGTSRYWVTVFSIFFWNFHHFWKMVLTAVFFGLGCSELRTGFMCHCMLHVSMWSWMKMSVKMRSTTWKLIEPLTIATLLFFGVGTPPKTNCLSMVV